MSRAYLPRVRLGWEYGCGFRAPVPERRGQADAGLSFLVWIQAVRLRCCNGSVWRRVRWPTQPGGEGPAGSLDGGRAGLPDLRTRLARGFWLFGSGPISETLRRGFSGVGCGHLSGAMSAPSWRWHCRVLGIDLVPSGGNLLHAQTAGAVPSSSSVCSVWMMSIARVMLTRCEL